MPAGLFAQSTLPGISFGWRFFGRKSCLHPCRGALRGGTKPVVSLTLNHRLQAWMPPASHSDAIVCFFFVRCLRADEYALHVTNVRSPRSAPARLHFLDPMRTRPPSRSVRGPTLPETAFPRSCLFFTHTTHRKQRGTLRDLKKNWY